MAKSKKLGVPMSDVIRQVIDEHCRTRKPPVPVAEWARRVMLKAAGRPDLIEEMRKPGKPKKAAGEE